MRKEKLFLLASLCFTLTACENYTSGPQGNQPAPGQQPRGTTDNMGRPTREPGPTGAMNPQGPGHTNPNQGGQR